MEITDHIAGFLHYRNDLGDGTRTGVVFGGCNGRCRNICLPYRFLPEHPFVEDEEEKKIYTPSELGEYLRLEAVHCYTKRIGITLLGNEPLKSMEFCYKLLRILKNQKMNVHLWTCGDLPIFNYETVRSSVDLFVVRFFAPLSGVFRPYPKFDHYKVIQTLQRMDAYGYPYRVYIPVLANVNTDMTTAFVAYLSPLQRLKSVILDFSSSGLTEGEIMKFRYAFLEKNIALY